jgi:ATP dependent DNA ligase domain
MPGVLRYNQPFTENAQRRLTDVLGATDGDAGAAFARLVQKLGLPQKLIDIGVGEDKFALISRVGWRSISALYGQPEAVRTRGGHCRVAAPRGVGLPWPSDQTCAVTIDGEIAALDQNGRSSFQLLQSYGIRKQIPLVYYAFDLLSLERTDLCARSLIERRKLLAKVLKRPNSVDWSVSAEIRLNQPRISVEFYLCTPEIGSSWRPQISE